MKPDQTERRDRKYHPLFQRLHCALQGLKASWQSEPNFRLQLAALAFVIVLLAATRPAAVWWAMLTLISGAVLAAELINTALEKLIDHLHPQRHETVRIIKDTLAAAVLALCVSAVAALAAFLTALAGP